MLFIIVLIVGVPVAVLAVEITAAFLARPVKPGPADAMTRPSFAVLIPAHNEGRGLAATLADIGQQMSVRDRLLVVADNCNDDTAEVARRSGVEVIERHDLDAVGKGFALDAGFRHLDADPREVLLVIDADCRIVGGTLADLASAALKSGRAVQALYLMEPPDAGTLNFQVAAFAWRVKNWVRPAGLRALGMPSHLMGTGMAFPWNVLRVVGLATGHIVEDVKLGLDLAAIGRPPSFYPGTVVASRFPLTREAAGNQRQRWEQGQLSLIAAYAPRLLRAALQRGDFQLLVLALDLAVPPLALLVLLQATALLITGGAAAAGYSGLPWLLSAATFCVFALSIALAWWRYGRDVLPPASIVRVAPYLFSKVHLYAGMLAGRRAHQWVRTDRE